MGCELLREGARHSMYINRPARKASAAPRHNEINDHLARKICRDLDVPLPAGARACGAAACGSPFSARGSGSRVPNFGCVLASEAPAISDELCRQVQRDTPGVRSSRCHPGVVRRPCLKCPRDKRPSAWRAQTRATSSAQLPLGSKKAAEQHGTVRTNSTARVARSTSSSTPSAPMGSARFGQARANAGDGLVRMGEDQRSLQAHHPMAIR